jgi:hypothetical protein
MRYFLLIVICLLSITESYSQIHEVGVFVGGSNFIGDVGSTKYIAPNQPAFGGIYKWNRSPRHSYRVSVLFTDLEGKDVNSSDPRRKQRGYEFNTSILEIAVGMEFTFVDFNLHNGGFISTPYLFAGVSVANHDNSFFLNGEQTSEDTSSWAYGIPFGLGYKAVVFEHLILAAEIGARYTFSDELDGSVPDSEFRQDLAFGNINNNDWYMFTGLTLTYTFGRNPCYCLGE